jgi:hypothetical protein
MLKKSIMNVLAWIMVVSLMVSVSACGGKATSASSEESSASESTESQEVSEEASSETASIAESSSEESNGSTTVNVSNGTSTSATVKVTLPQKTTDQALVVDDKYLVGTGVLKDPSMTEQVTNLGGKTFTIGTFWSTDWKPESTSTAGIANMKAIASIEKDFNCKIKTLFIDPNSYLADAATARASGQVFANIYESQREMDNLIKNGEFAELSTVNSIGLKTNEWNKAITLGGTYKNGVYGVGLKQESIGRNCIFFNKMLASKYNLGDFYAMVNNKEWTTEKFLEISKSVYNQSGKKVYGTVSVFQPYMLGFVYMNNSTPIVLKNGIPAFNGLDDSLLNMMNYAADYSNQGLYDKKHSTGFVTSFNQFISDKDLFYIADWWIREDLSAKMPNDYGILPLPKGPNAKDYTTLITNTRYLSLSKGDPDLENSGKLLVALANRSYIKKAEWDKQISGSIRDAQSLDMLHLLMSGNATFFKSLSTYETAAMKCVVDQSMTAKQAMQSVEQSAQAEINTIFS